MSWSIVSPRLILEDAEAVDEKSGKVPRVVKGEPVEFV